MYIWLVLALIFALLEAIVVLKNLQRLEYLAKPAVMAYLFLWLYSNTGLRGNIFWFGLGVLFSLVGDFLLMISPDLMFLFGLIAFLFVHIFYITGFKEELATINAWSLILAWNKFVSAIKNGRVWSIALYHLGQIGLVTGVIAQFG